jgi:O-antigen/teichoic acid export membrane protein
LQAGSARGTLSISVTPPPPYTIARLCGGFKHKKTAVSASQKNTGEGGDSVEAKTYAVMQKDSLGGNFLWNIARITANLIFPLAVFPHITRVLGPEYFGKTEYAASLISYFVLFSAIGVPIYGVREIARNQNNAANISKTVWELTLLLCVSVMAGYAVYFALVFFVPSLRGDLPLFAAIAPTMLLVNFNYEWFYVGTEQQKAMTLRSVAIKILQAALIFYFVKRPDDFIRYVIITVCAAGLQAAWNIFRLKKIVCGVPFAELNIKKHIAPLATIFAATISVSIYTNIDTFMVGAMAGGKAAGMYAAANRIIRLVIFFIASLAGVLVPRIENALHSKNFASYSRHLNRSARLHLIVACPCAGGIFLFAPEIIRVMTGSAYTESIFSARLLCPVILIVALANFVGFHVLYPCRKEKSYTSAVFVSAVCNVLVNLLLIPRFRQNGAIMGTLAAETIGLVMLFIFARGLLKNTQLFSLNSAKYGAASCAMSFLLWRVKSKLDGDALTLSVCIPLGAFIYAAALVLLRETTAKSIVRHVLFLRSVS